jgi:soluble lytic murein transglycosylase-like protein
MNGLFGHVGFTGNRARCSGAVALGLCALSLPVWAGEDIVLRTGFRLAADRHEVDGEVIRIYAGAGVTEMSVSLVAAVETLDSASAETPAARPSPATPRVVPVEYAQPKITQADVVHPDLSPGALASAAARKYSLPDAFVASVMRAESGFNPAALSPKGAIGLMQLMPATARELGVDANRPAENADAGARYLRDLLAKYEYLPDQVVLALAAYNAGPAAVDKFHGVPPYRETREYILRVLKDWNPPSASK